MHLNLNKPYRLRHGVGRIILWGQRQQRKGSCLELKGRRRIVEENQLKAAKDSKLGKMLIFQEDRKPKHAATDAIE